MVDPKVRTKSLPEIIRNTTLFALKALLVLSIVVAFCAVYGYYIEVRWIKVNHVTLSTPSTIRVIHISDIHFKGNAAYLEKVVAIINNTPADFVCFTGDLVENSNRLRGCLNILATLNKPIYGITGNHDDWARVPLDDVKACFQKTGGDLVNNVSIPIMSGKIELTGSTTELLPAGSHSNAVRKILMLHYPTIVETIRNRHFDAILTGHTHGGQVRLPFMGSVLDVGRYDLGLFKTPAGPLYVNPGLGTFYRDVRFLCRPEITIIEL